MQGSIIVPLSNGFTRTLFLQTFLLKVTTIYDDGSLFVLKSVPCEAGSSNEICIVEVRATECHTRALIRIHCYGGIGVPFSWMNLHASLDLFLFI